MLFIQNFQVLQVGNHYESWKSLLKKMLSAFPYTWIDFSLLVSIVKSYL